MVLSVTAIVLAVVSYGYLQTPLAKNQIAQLLEQRLGESTGYVISIEELNGNLPQEFIFKNLTVLDKEHQELFTAEQTSLYLNVWELLFGTLQITHLEADTPRFKYSFLKSVEETLSSTESSDQVAEVSGAISRPSLIQTIEVLAPNIKVYNGELIFTDLKNVSPEIPHEVIFQNFNLDMFVEINSEHSFFDIAYLEANIPDTKSEYIDIRGQIYNDDDYLELNAFSVNTAHSNAYLFAEISGIQIQSENLIDQLTNAYYNIRIDTANVDIAEFHDFFPALQNINEVVRLHTWVDGDKSLVNIRDHEMEFSDNYLSLTGSIAHITDLELLTYEGTLRNLRFSSETFKIIEDEIPIDAQLDDLSQIQVTGSYIGNLKNISIESKFNLPEGQFDVDADFILEDELSYELALRGSSINLAHFPALTDLETNINFEGFIHGTGYSNETLSLYSELTFQNTYIGGSDFEYLRIFGTYSDRYFEPNLEYRNRNERLFAESSVLLVDSYINVWMDGTSENLDLLKLRPILPMPRTNLNFDFMMDIQIADNVDESYGWISADVRESEVDSVMVRSHQFYGDLDPPSQELRKFRFTSSFLDIIADGNIRPSEFYNLQEKWMAYLKGRYQDEILMTPENGLPEHEEDNGNFVSLDVVAELKDLELLKHYFPIIPVDQSFADVQFRLFADNDRLEVDGYLTDRQFEANGIRTEDVSIQFFTELNRDQRLRDFSVLDLDIRLDKLNYNGQNAEDLSLDFALRNGRAIVSSSIDRMGENISFDSQLEIAISESGIYAELNNLRFGSPGYEWVNIAQPKLAYMENNRLEISDFVFENNEQYLQIEGVLSPHPEDQLFYDINQLNLEPISDFINPLIAFSGYVDGRFMTQSLSTDPIFEGDLLIDQFSLEDRIVGDIRIRSSFNPTSNQFETNLSILTDEEKYSELLAEQGAVGQQIYLDGVFESQKTARENNRNYHFDVDIVKADLWFIPLLVRNIFERTEGLATGSGVITGTFDEIDFAGEVDIEHGKIWPVFFGTEYDMSGSFKISRNEGFRTDGLYLTDNLGGRGRIFGDGDFNDFEDERFLNFTLEMENLLFLNNQFDPDVPFFGRVFGTGSANVSGSNLDPYLRTISPIVTSQRSSLSIPLLPETRVEEQGRFIHFVKDFSEVANFDRRRESEVEFSAVDQTFTELFRLDLQFIAENDANVSLIFDPVTEEIMNARGNGRMRIMLEDEEYSMFGRFDITEGDYMFVGGDIFTRRFSLREGGSIVWDGDPENARLNVVAAYRSRPNINALLGLDQQDVPAQRIPVDLMLLITGTIETVENDFYFEFPNSVDAAQNAAILAILNSEEQKFLQATSLLLTGGFIPTGVEGQSDQLIATTQSRAGQVGVSQLLSSQINSIINANLANLDIDLNLTGFDQADLGIALRLFDDRLVLRRDGQVAGDQTDIGDLGAKYRISNALSVEVFHRKDPSLIAIIGAQGGQVESVNGVGLEAQMQFNTWKELRDRVWGGIRSIFVRREEETEEDSENVAARF